MSSASHAPRLNLRARPCAAHVAVHRIGTGPMMYANVGEWGVRVGPGRARNGHGHGAGQADAAESCEAGWGGEGAVRCAMARIAAQLLIGADANKQHTHLIGHARTANVKVCAACKPGE